MDYQRIWTVVSLCCLIGIMDNHYFFKNNGMIHAFSVINYNIKTITSSSLLMKGNSDYSFLKYTKASRSADVTDTVVELMRPLGLVLKEDEFRNVFVETVAPAGNAARDGQIKEGDYIVMCSATFGDDMWSTRGAGLSRVLNAIRVRSGSKVKLVVESRNQAKKKQNDTVSQLKARNDAAKAAQFKKDTLLKELENDEKVLNPKKFFGLF